MERRSQQGSLKDLISLFLVYGMFFIPFPFTILRFQEKLSNLLFGPIVKFMGTALFNYDKVGKINSDSVGMYLLVLFLLLLSLTTVLLVKAFRPGRERWIRLYGICQYIGMAYLALILFKYGIDKVFRNQFYVPAPNTLFTPIGNAERDLLFWSAMGSSYLYSLFLGVLEILTAFLILFRRTRLAGLILSFGILLNVLAINFGFDISVKLYSLFLLLLNCYLLSPYYQSLSRFFSGLIVKTGTPLRASFKMLFLKWLFVLLFFSEGLYPFISKTQTNSALLPKPFSPGAYEVRQVISGPDTLPVRNFPIHRVFFHKSGFMVFENWTEEMNDYRVMLDSRSQYLILTDYGRKQTVLPFRYETRDSTLYLTYLTEGRTYQVIAKGIDWGRMPLMKKGFHWFADGPQ